MESKCFWKNEFEDESPTVDCGSTRCATSPQLDNHTITLGQPPQQWRGVFCSTPRPPPRITGVALVIRQRRPLPSDFRIVLVGRIATSAGAAHTRAQAVLCRRRNATDDPTGMIYSNKRCGRRPFLRCRCRPEACRRQTCRLGISVCCPQPDAAMPDAATSALKVLVEIPLDTGDDWIGTRICFLLGFLVNVSHMDNTILYGFLIAGFREARLNRSAECRIPSPGS